MGFAKDFKVLYDIDCLQYYCVKIEEMCIKIKWCIIVMVYVYVFLVMILCLIQVEDGIVACIALFCCNYYFVIDVLN